MSQAIIEKKAIEFRQRCGLDDQSPIVAESLLYRLGVIAVFKPLGDGFSGMCVKVTSPKTERFVLINSSMFTGKQNFTLCHELYHLFVQKSFTSMICSTGRFDRKTGEEYNADLFAAYILMPETGIKSMIPVEEYSKNKITLSTVLKIEQYFGCSRTALLYRLKQLAFIDGVRYEELKWGVKRGAIEHGYNTYLYEPGNHNKIIGDYGTIARKLFQEDVISESHYYQLLLDLGINIDQLERFPNVEEG